MNLNKEQSEKYLEIVWKGNMDDMFDFGRQSTISEIIELLPEEMKVELMKNPRYQDDIMASGFNSCRQIIIERLEKMK